MILYTILIQEKYIYIKYIHTYTHTCTHMLLSDFFSRIVSSLRTADTERFPNVLLLNRAANYCFVHSYPITVITSKKVISPQLSRRQSHVRMCNCRNFFRTCVCVRERLALQCNIFKSRRNYPHWRHGSLVVCRKINPAARRSEQYFSSLWNNAVTRIIRFLIWFNLPNERMFVKLLHVGPPSVSAGPHRRHGDNPGRT